MQLCSDRHEEICYETKQCPACEVITDLENEIQSLLYKIERLERRIIKLSEEQQ
jgi:hypothetical protein